MGLLGKVFEGHVPGIRFVLRYPVHGLQIVPLICPFVDYINRKVEFLRHLPRLRIRCRHGYNDTEICLKVYDFDNPRLVKLNNMVTKKYWTHALHTRPVGGSSTAFPMHHSRRNRSMQPRVWRPNPSSDKVLRGNGASKCGYVGTGLARPEVCPWTASSQTSATLRLTKLVA